ncbi:MAG TPA: MFS transporter, partial [Thermoanaerobaculia bacterium]|nr:MFS transporter [Thermoanaerobaculia bacterium]
TPQGMKAFLVLWAGPFISAIGSSLGGFSLGVWVYERTHSATSFALVAFVGTVTLLLLSPVAGAVADHWDRRKLILLADLGSALTTATMAVLFFTHLMQPWMVYPIAVLMMTFLAFQGPALGSSVPLLVGRKQLARASGIAQTGRAISQILGPLTAGILIGWIGYQGVALVDALTYLVAVTAALLIRIPSPPPLEGAAVQRSVRANLAFGWSYLQQRKGLVALLILFGVTNFCMGMVQVLLTPLLLSFATPVELGTVSSTAAVGVLVGGLAVAIWGIPRHRVLTVLGVIVVQSLILFLGGAQPSIPLIALAAFLFMLAIPFALASTQTILQSKVASAVQGRVFAVSGMVSAGALPLAALLAGPLADKVFGPLLLPGGRLADTPVGHYLGVAPGRGVGLMFICLGILSLITVGLFALNPRLRNLESEIPDALLPEPAAPAAPVPGEPSLENA